MLFRQEKTKIKMISYFTWGEFDKSVEQIANKCRFKDFSGIYGVPRGGLCLAVALSHKLKIELISEPLKNSLIVDDVYETGLTLTTFKDIEGAMFFVLLRVFLVFLFCFLDSFFEYLDNDFCMSLFFKADWMAESSCELSWGFANAGVATTIREIIINFR